MKKQTKVTSRESLTLDCELAAAVNKDLEGV